IRTALGEHDLDSAEGRVSALRRCVPMVARIKDSMLRDEYARRLAGWVGWADVAQGIGRVREEARQRGMPDRSGRRSGGAEHAQRRQRGAQVAPAGRPDPADPTLWPQREALKSALQYPALAGPVFDSLTVESFTHPGYAAVRGAIEGAGGTSAGLAGAQWIEAVREQTASPAAASLVNELGVEAINVDDDDKMRRYIGGGAAPPPEEGGGPQIAEGKAQMEGKSPAGQGAGNHALRGTQVGGGGQ